MDKVKLNREQLQEVVAYIERRGFKDPLVLVEILDHFACKVEEKMEARPGITLGAAIVAAHADFGPMGFRPLTKSFEEAAHAKYKAIFNSERKSLLKSPLFVLSTGVASFLFAKAIAFLPMRFLFLWHETLPIMDALYFGYIIALLSLTTGVPKRLRGTAAVRAVHPTMTIFLLPVCGSLSRAIVSYPDEIGALGTLAAALFFYLVLDVFSAKHSLKQAVNEGSVVDYYLRRLQSA